MINRYSLVGLMLLLSGCASQNHFLGERQSTIDHFALEGKVAIVYAKEVCQKERCQQRSDQGKLRWAQTNDRYFIQVLDPFSKLIYEVEGDLESANLKSSDGLFLIDDPEAFLLEALKIDAPLSSLRYWLTGRVAPNSGFTLIENGFIQNDYQVLATGWLETSLGMMPTQIDIQHEGSRLRIVVKNWRFNLE